MSFFWSKCKDVLPEESGRIASRPLGAALYRALVAVEDEAHSIHTYEAIRLRRFETGISALDMQLKETDKTWHWEIIGPPGTVIAWTWMPDEKDAGWVRDKMPEEAEDAGVKVSKACGIEGVAVLALVKMAAYPSAGPEAHVRSRYRLHRGSKVSDWAWSSPDGILAWMPVPKYQKERRNSHDVE